MCGRYVTPDEAALERFWTLDRRNWNPFPQSFNVAPTSVVPFVRRAGDGAYELSAARWGLIPHWWSKATPPSLTFNARSEEAAVKPMWREGYRHLRCLMPAQGWYEWQERGDLTPTRKGRAPKQPYYIHCDQFPVIAQAEVAERVGTTQCAIARLESAAPKHSPSIATVRRYARALGNRLEVRLVKHQQADAPQRRRAQVNGVPISQLAAPARPTPSGDAVCDRQPSRRR